MYCIQPYTPRKHINTVVNNKIHNMGTEIISSRVKPTQYQQILLECDKKGLNISDWLQLQIARSAESERIKSTLIHRLSMLKIQVNSRSESAAIKLKVEALIDYIKNAL